LQLRGSTGNSREQRRSEAVTIAALAEQLRIECAPRRVAFGGGIRVELDAAPADLSVLVEVCVHQGAAKSAQRDKVLTDAFKSDFRRPRARRNETVDSALGR
jgi:hypothetical protein